MSTYVVISDNVVQLVSPNRDLALNHAAKLHSYSGKPTTVTDLNTLVIIKEHRA